MLESQRHLFAIEAGITYLDSATMGPIPRAVEQRAHEAASSKARPWTRNREHAHAQAQALREFAARLVGATASDMAITCSASYGLAVARRNLPVPAGERVLVLEADHSSQMLTWQAHAARCGAVLDVVPRPADDNWTQAILDHLDRPDGRPVSIASMCANFWLDGARIDLKRVCDKLRAMGSRIVLDVTQSVGVVDLDVGVLDPDFMVFPMYKWLLGPYSLAFLYVAPRWQHGEPLEQNSFNRVPGDYAPGAGRFDMGERDVFVGIPTALASLSLVTGWARSDIETRLAHLTTRLAGTLKTAGFQCIEETSRGPHILGVKAVPEGTALACRQRGVFLTQRGDGLRISPHVFNTEADIDHCAATLVAVREPL